jgi:hypothetical protein
LRERAQTAGFSETSVNSPNGLISTAGANTSILHDVGGDITSAMAVGSRGVIADVLASSLNNRALHGLRGPCLFEDGGPRNMDNQTIGTVIKIVVDFVAPSSRLESLPLRILTQRWA